MPIYEFYCSECHRIYNFFSRTINTTKRPDCPRCGRPKLERRMSRFAIGSAGVTSTEPDSFGLDAEDLPPGLDEEKMERIMEELAREADGVNEEDPRHMGRLMRKVFEATGMPIEGPMAEAIRRLESGEDPDKIEEDLGEVLDEMEPPWASSSQSQEKSTEKKGTALRGWVRKMLPPEVDETLYDL